MTTVNVYLTFNGNCEEAFNFYKSAFGGEFPYVGRFKEMPADASNPISPEDGEKIMHISLPISKETVIQGSDTIGEWVSGYTKGNNFSISINTSTAQEADRLFNKLSEGGHVTMPMNKTFWGAYFGMFVDKFGVAWMVNVDENASKG